jgi:hypothetical protein
MLYNESKHNILAYQRQARPTKDQKNPENHAVEQQVGLHCQAMDRARLQVFSMSHILEAKSHQKHHIGSNFWRFYLNRIGFTLGEPCFFGGSVF